MLNSVIVVDDEASILTAVEQWLTLSGFSVQLHNRAEACLAQLPEHFPGVVVSDVRMPGMDGLQLLEQLLARDADLPVILLTGHGDVPMAVQAMRKGPTTFWKNRSAPKTCSAACAAPWKNANWCWKTARYMSRPTSRRGWSPRCLACPKACSSYAVRYWSSPRYRSMS